MDVFTTGVLTRVVRGLDEPLPFLLNRFFPTEQTEDSEEIHFDRETEKRRITPFVAPHVAGKVVQELGYTTATFKPAYAKDKRIFNPKQPLKRAIGEQIGGSLSPQDRRNLALRRAIEDQLEMLVRREEVMASEVLRTGKVTVSGEGYATQTVDFNRDAALSVTLSGLNLWSDTANATPVDDLENWAATIQSKSGAVVDDVIMDPEAWKNFRTFQAVKDLLDTRRGSQSTAELGPDTARKAKLKGQIGSFNVWVYQDVYVDDAGVEQKMLPDGTVLLGGDQLDGVRAYGAILDEEAGYAAQRFHVKSWLEKDPAVRYLLLQSAPLVVPYRANASLAATVL